MDYRERGSRACKRCATHTGYIEYMKTSKDNKIIIAKDCKKVEEMNASTERKSET